MLRIRPHLTVLAVSLLLCALVVPRTAWAQGESYTNPCIPGLELSAEFADLDLAGLQGALQQRIDDNPDATVALFLDGVHEFAVVPAALLLADEAVLSALIEGASVNLTLEGSGGPRDTVIGIEVSSPEDCTVTVCGAGLVPPASLAGLDLAGVREALEDLVARDADAIVDFTVEEGEGGTVSIPADLLLGLADPVLEAVLTGDLIAVTLDTRDESIVAIAIPDGPAECEGDGGEPEPEPGDIQDDQQGDDSKGDQQGGSKGTVTKTFQLTLNGTVPEAEAFAAIYTPIDRSGGEITAGPSVYLVFCGPFESGDPLDEVVPGEAVCVGDGTVYRQTVRLPAGSEIDFIFYRYSALEADTDAARFHAGTEILTEDMTNTAWYTFGEGTGVEDDQQVDEGAGKDTGAGDVQDRQQDENDQQDSGTVDDQRGDRQEDAINIGAGDDQQVEIPGMLPETGGGGLAPGATNPVRGAVAALTFLVGAGCTLLRRR